MNFPTKFLNFSKIPFSALFLSFNLKTRFFFHLLFLGKDPKELKEMSVGGMEGKEIEKTDVWWFTTNEYAFDTIGFLTVDDLDALMCGDCEFGPIGWRTSDNKNFWIAAERMSYA